MKPLILCISRQIGGTPRSSMDLSGLGNFKSRQICTAIRAVWIEKYGCAADFQSSSPPLRRRPGLSNNRVIEIAAVTHNSGLLEDAAEQALALAVLDRKLAV